MYYFSCPACKNSEQFYRVDRASSSNLFLVWLLGDLLVAAIVAHYEARIHVQCGRCGYVFPRPRIGSSRTSVGVKILTLCACLAAGLGALTHWAPNSMPWTEYAMLLKPWIERYSLGIASAVLLGVPSLLLIAWVIRLVASARHRKRVRADYEHTPTKRPPMPSAASSRTSMPSADAPVTDS